MGESLANWPRRPAAEGLLDLIAITGSWSDKITCCIVKNHQSCMLDDIFYRIQHVLSLC